ncbi:hypothetical protein E2C01_085645 [Portunus trituberculatus]|uniref:Uncharacterized protein n=1 Tax=Portunus trituberculatus TaxID=210409 RepID=A0A5B7JCI4_PORTR|nr:hypothetical protein [Portunus trituberculatus]
MKMVQRGPPWCSRTMLALGSEGSPSARVRIMSTVHLHTCHTCPNWLRGQREPDRCPSLNTEGVKGERWQKCGNAC